MKCEREAERVIKQKNLTREDKKEGETRRNATENW